MSISNNLTAYIHTKNPNFDLDCPTCYKLFDFNNNALNNTPTPQAPVRTSDSCVDAVCRECFERNPQNCFVCFAPITSRVATINQHHINAYKAFKDSFDSKIASPNDTLQSIETSTSAQAPKKPQKVNWTVLTEAIDAKNSMIRTIQRIETAQTKIGKVKQRIIDELKGRENASLEWVAMEWIASKNMMAIAAITNEKRELTLHWIGVNNRRDSDKTFELLIHALSEYINQTNIFAITLNFSHPLESSLHNLVVDVVKAMKCSCGISWNESKTKSMITFIPKDRLGPPSPKVDTSLVRFVKIETEIGNAHSNYQQTISDLLMTKKIDECFVSSCAPTDRIVKGAQLITAFKANPEDFCIYLIDGIAAGFIKIAFLSPSNTLTIESFFLKPEYMKNKFYFIEKLLYWSFSKKNTASTSNTRTVEVLFKNGDQKDLFVFLPNIADRNGYSVHISVQNAFKTFSIIKKCSS